MKLTKERSVFNDAPSFWHKESGNNNDAIMAVILLYEYEKQKLMNDCVFHGFFFMEINARIK